MTIEQIIGYATNTPTNTNKAILKDMLEELTDGDTPVGPTEEWKIAGIYYAGYPGYGSPETFTISFETTPKKIRCTGFFAGVDWPNNVQFHLDGSDTKEIVEQVQNYEFSTGDGQCIINFDNDITFRHLGGNDNYLSIVEYI